MARRKMTPFGRFFIALLIIAPLAYVGASYYNGQDPLASLRNLFSNQTTNTTKYTPTTTTTGASDARVKELQREVDLLEKRVERLEYLLRNNSNTNSSTTPSKNADGTRKPW